MDIGIALNFRVIIVQEGSNDPDRFHEPKWFHDPIWSVITWCYDTNVIRRSPTCGSRHLILMSFSLQTIIIFPAEIHLFDFAFYKHVIKLLRLVLCLFVFLL